MRFDKEISELSDVDLPRHKDFLFDMILGRDQPEAHRSEMFRSKVLERVEKTNKEISRRNGSEDSNTGGDSSESED
jgi:hypothetical protein